jgi:Ca2+-binding EF-hand superfamily protein
MKILPVFASAALLLPLSALASEAVTFEELDSDGNKVIDQQEAQAHPPLVEVFDSADRDQDGELSQEEFAYAVAMIGTEYPDGQRSGGQR